MKNFPALISLLCFLAFYSCTRSKDNNGIAAGDLRKEPVPAGTTPGKKTELPDDRKVIKEGELTFETADVTATKSLIDRTVRELDGYISKDEAHEYGDRIQHSVTIRVRADKFDTLVQEISESVKKLDSKNVNVLDVTAEFIDIESRIKTKKELQERYREILKKANKVEEILSIEREIGQLQTEIESVEGQMKYMKDRISLSTLSVSYYQKTSALNGFSSQFSSAVKSGWDILLMLIVGIAHLWALGLLGLIVFFVVKRLRRTSRK